MRQRNQPEPGTRLHPFDCIVPVRVISDAPVIEVPGLETEIADDGGRAGIGYRR